MSSANERHGGLSRQGMLLVVVFVLYIVLTYFPRPPSSSKNYYSSGNWPKHLTLLNHDVYYELPPSEAPTGILLFAHGCAHSASEMWPSSERCANCEGLPEDVRIRQIAIFQRNFAVIAVSSLKATLHGKGCWSTRGNAETGQDDIVSVPEIVAMVIERERALRDLPIYALGASSGGGFVLHLPKTMNLAGICAQIMGISAETLEAQASFDGHPATIFMHMPSDELIAAVVEADIATLEATRVPVAELKVHPRAITIEYLMEHSNGGISTETAERVLEALREGGFLDGAGMLQENPSETEWEEALNNGGVVDEGFSFAGMKQLLKVGWANHEIVSSGVNAALQWLERGGEADLKRLVAAEEKNEKAILEVGAKG